MVTQQNVEVKIGSSLFTEELWLEIADNLAAAFRMNPLEADTLRKNRMARLVAALPFLAGCEDAGRTAVAHLGTYLLSVRETKRWFCATPEDSSSIMERLRLGSSFKGGDKDILQRGMSLLALNMISDYKRDLSEDAALGKYNPLGAGDFKFEETVEELEWAIAKRPCDEMDEIITAGEMPLSYWVEG
ncbi:MAG: hypothetical protein A3J97_01255 [Spirochaetes bacterium RIFOXYC1_FULL_54_7]|nr:MAG: hypothetical protein A3J97_01255 [Spirochaetes bacterium RIFOXYC1_FULL_54_7]